MMESKLRKWANKNAYHGENGESVLPVFQNVKKNEIQFTKEDIQALLFRCTKVKEYMYYRKVPQNRCNFELFSKKYVITLYFNTPLKLKFCIFCFHVYIHFVNSFLTCSKFRIKPQMKKVEVIKEIHV